MKKLLFTLGLFLCFLPIAASDNQHPNEQERTVWLEKNNISVTTDSQNPREIEYMTVVQRFNEDRDNYFALTPLETTRENIRKAQAKAEQCKKRTFGLIEDCDFALNLLAILLFCIFAAIGLYDGIVHFKLREKIRLYLKHRNSKHSLDDIFDMENKR